MNILLALCFSVEFQYKDACKSAMENGVRYTSFYRDINRKEAEFSKSAREYINPSEAVERGTLIAYYIARTISSQKVETPIVLPETKNTVLTLQAEAARIGLKININF